MKYKVTATMDVGYETIIEASSEGEALDLAKDIEWHLWEEVSSGMDWELVDVEEVT